jgi:hypothetical protein
MRLLCRDPEKHQESFRCLMNEEACHALFR